MITKLEAYKYRCYQTLQAELGEFQVLVGANGSGKTTLLDLVDLFSEMSQTKQAQDVFVEPTATHPRPRTGILKELVNEKRGNFFGLAVEVQLPVDISQKAANKIKENATTKTAASMILDENLWPGYLRYELQFTLLNEQLEVAGEYLTLLPNDRKRWENAGNGIIGETEIVEKPFVFPVLSRQAGASAELLPEYNTKTGKVKSALSLKLPSDTLGLSNIPADPTQFATTLWFIDFLQNETCPYRPNFLKMRDASKPQDKNDKLLPDAANIAWLVKELQEDKETHEEWCEHIRIALPTIKTIQAATREDDNFAYFTVEYQSGLKVNSASVSDGTLAIIAYTILPFLPGHRLPKLITIEEPENGIHPKGIEAVLEAISSVKTSHVWVTSHSPIVVAHTEPDKLLCLRATSEGVVATPGTQHPRLKEWKGTPGIETLFGAGVLS